LEKFRRKIEEYKATMFVLELGTAQSISPRGRMKIWRKNKFHNI